MQIWSSSEDVKYVGAAISLGSSFHVFVSLAGETRDEAGKKKDENRVYLYLTT